MLTKNELMKTLWPDTFVEEANLAFQVSALRKALGEEGQQWIETLPKHGYRFGATVTECRPDGTEPSVLEKPSPSRRPLFGWRRAAIIVAILCAAVGGIAFWWFTRKPAAMARRNLQRLTFDPGLSTDPALSHDGRFLAYASDRLGADSLDIWVRQLGGGEPMRIADDAMDDREPTFSPDGAQIAFRSERDGGGIYVVPTLGGQPPKLLAKYGRRPRYSPDGKWIAYWVGSLGIGHLTGRGSGTIYVVPSNGGPPQEVQPQFAAARYPVWSPDGKWILFVGSREPTSNVTPELRHYEGDWFVASFEGRNAQETGVFPLLKQEHLLPPLGTLQTAPSEWRGDRIIFAAASGDSTNLWQVRLSANTFKATGPLERLTFGTGLEVQPAQPAGSSNENASPIVFASLAANMDIWSLPVPGDRFSGSVEPQRLTENGSADFVHSISPDGKKLLFLTNRTGRAEKWMKDLDTGSESPFIATPGRAMFSADGMVVGHTIPGPDWPIYVTPAKGGIAGKLCDRCGTFWHWSSDGKRIVYTNRESDKPIYFEVLELPSGNRSKFLQDPELNLYIPSFSPDDRWVQFMARIGPGRNQGFVVPFATAGAIQRSDWIPITDSESWVDAFRWSLDGRRVYFLSESDGFRCIWAQDLDPATKRRSGPALAVYHSHRTRLSIMNLTWGHGALAISRDRVVFGQGEINGSLWITKN